jgi:hypothetical protein
MFFWILIKNKTRDARLACASQANEAKALSSPSEMDRKQKDQSYLQIETRHTSLS